MDVIFINFPTAEQLVDLHNQLSLLQWENQQQKIEIQNLRNGISAFQQNEAVLTQTIQQQKLVIEDLRNGAEAANSGVVNQLEQQVVKFQGKLAENSVMLRQYWRIIRAKDIVILDLQMENGRCNSKKELLKKELKVAKEVLRYHQCFPAFVQQLDPSAAAPSSIPKLTIKRAKTAPPLSRLKLANPFIPITEDEKENTFKVNGVYKNPSEVTNIPPPSRRARVTFTSTDGPTIIAQNRKLLSNR